MITINQYQYRAYLNSPVWKEIRRRTLEKHGTICNRCGEYGNDVHHKTYERVGGNERPEDLEVLCRDCHKAHHRVEKISGKKRRKKSLHVKGVMAYLTQAQKSILEKQFKGSLYVILYGLGPRYDSARKEAMKMLNLGSIFGIPRGRKQIHFKGKSINHREVRYGRKIQKNKKRKWSRAGVKKRH